MGWVYYWRLVDSKFQARVLAARFEDAEGWMYQRVPKHIGVFRTQSGKYGIKVRW